MVGRIVNKLSDIAAGRRRRLRIWAISVLVIIVALILQNLWPQFRISPLEGNPLSIQTVLLIFLAALFCEYLDSSLGMGYGTTLTPLLLLAGFAPLQIVPCVLMSEFFTGLSAALLHHREGNVDLIRDREVRSTAILLSVLSIVGACSAVFLAIRISKVLLTIIISVIVLSVGIITLATTNRQLRYRKGHIIALGAIAAFNKGLSGGGYGPLVTSGQVVSGLAAKKAIAITSLAESLVCIVGLVTYLVAGKSIDWALAIPLVLGAGLSVPLATITVKCLSEKHMRTGVGLATCALGIFALVRLL